MALKPAWDGAYAMMLSFQKTIEGFEERHIAKDEFITHNQTYLEHLLTRLETNWRGCQRAVTEFEEASAPANSDEASQEIYFELSAIAKIVGDSEKTIRSRIRQLTAQENQPIPKPSEIHLEKYDGDYAEWSSWSAQVQSAVIDVDIPIHSKIDLILQALGDTIKPSIGKAESRDQCELDRIWDKLHALCSNPYDRARTHIGAILDLPVLNKPTDKDVRKLIDTVDFQLRALKRMEFDVAAWDPMIIEILLRKMDKSMIRIWERERDQIELPTLKSLITFFERQVQSIRNLNRVLKEVPPTASQKDSTNSKHPAATSDGSNAKRFKRSNDASASGHNQQDRPRSRDDSQRKASANANGQPKPPRCRMECPERRPHFLWNCVEFRKLNVDERLSRISSWKLCRRCLIAEHDVATCKAQACNNCEEIHNRMLCPKFRVYSAVNSAQGKKRSRSGRAPGGQKA